MIGRGGGGKKRQATGSPRILSTVYERQESNKLSKLSKLPIPIPKPTPATPAAVAAMVDAAAVESLENHRSKLRIPVLKKLDFSAHNLQIIGQGGYGKVLKWNDAFVIKVPLAEDQENTTSTEKKTIDTVVARELCMYEETKDLHPNIVKVAGLAVLGNEYGIVFENAGIELFAYVKSAFTPGHHPLWMQCRRNMGFPDSDTVITKPTLYPILDRYVDDFAVQLLNGLVHLHSNKIFHNDIKLENILVSVEDDALHLKYADFGFAHCPSWKYRTEEQEHYLGFFSTRDKTDLSSDMPYSMYFGSPAYIPDPAIGKRREFVYRRDQYALGISLYACAYGGLLYRMPHSSDETYCNFTKKMNDIEQDTTGNVFFGQLNGVTRRAPIESLLKRLISFKPDFVGNIWKEFSPTTEATDHVQRVQPTCVIEKTVREGDDCLKDEIVWDPHTGPHLVKKG